MDADEMVLPGWALIPHNDPPRDPPSWEGSRDWGCDEDEPVVLLRKRGDNVGGLERHWVPFLKCTVLSGAYLPHELDRVSQELGRIATAIQRILDAGGEI